MLIVKSKQPKSKYAYGGSSLRGGYFPFHHTTPLGPFSHSPGEYGYGNGLFDIAKKLLKTTAKTSIGKKVLDSSIGKKVLKSATIKNLQKAANSKLGKKLEKQLLSGVAKATESAAEGALMKLGVPVSNKRRRKRTPKTSKKRKGNGIVFD